MKLFSFKAYSQIKFSPSLAYTTKTAKEAVNLQY